MAALCITTSKLANDRADKFADFYPTEWKTKFSRDDFRYLKLHCRERVSEHYFATHTTDTYRMKLSEQSCRSPYDMHEKNFQDWALKTLSLTHNSVPGGWHKAHLERTKFFAISTRSDLSWEGEYITDAEQAKKQKEMEEYWIDFTLYDWCQIPPKVGGKLSKLLSKPNGQLTVKVTCEDTLTATSNCYRRLGKESRVGWLNLANAHNVGGGYNRGMGTQEENTVTRCTALAQLTLAADPLPDSIYEYFHSSPRGDTALNPLKYRPGFHLPPGGASICRTRFLDAPLQKQFNCYVISMASADFREKTSWRPFAEAGDFDIKADKEAYCKRVLIDLEAVCLTALYNKLDCLVLGATGCGAFQHDPEIEAALWHEVLNTYGPNFKEIVFAIRERNPSKAKNLDAFAKEFGVSVTTSV